MALADWTSVDNRLSACPRGLRGAADPPWEIRLKQFQDRSTGILDTFGQLSP